MIAKEKIVKNVLSVVVLMFFFLTIFSEENMGSEKSENNKHDVTRETDKIILVAFFYENKYLMSLIEEQNALTQELLKEMKEGHSDKEKNESFSLAINKYSELIGKQKERVLDLEKKIKDKFTLEDNRKSANPQMKADKNGTPNRLSHYKEKVKSYEAKLLKLDPAKDKDLIDTVKAMKSYYEERVQDYKDDVHGVILEVDENTIEKEEDSVKK